MQTVFNHIESIKAKPHRVRKQIAFLYAAVVAGLIGLVWISANLSTGAFAIRDSNFADAAKEKPVTTVPSSGLAGAAGAAGASLNTMAPAHIEIVDTKPAPSPKPEQTTIPF